MIDVATNAKMDKVSVVFLTRIPQVINKNYAMSLQNSHRYIQTKTMPGMMIALQNRMMIHRPHVGDNAFKKYKNTTVS